MFGSITGITEPVSAQEARVIHGARWYFFLFSVVGWLSAGSFSSGRGSGCGLPARLQRRLLRTGECIVLTQGWVNSTGARLARLRVFSLMARPYAYIVAASGPFLLIGCDQGLPTRLQGRLLRRQGVRLP